VARRTNSFARALKDAEGRLQKAVRERTAIQAKLQALEIEIPRLQVTISALYHQLDPKVKSIEGVKTDTRPYVPGFEPTPPPNLGPEALAKWYHDRDLSGVGSIPQARPAEPAVEVSEDELLPDDFAVGKKE